MAKRKPSRSGKHRPPPARSAGRDATTHGEKQTGLVVARYGHTFAVEDAQGRLHRCAGRRRWADTVAGDRVCWQPGTGDLGVITDRFDRRTLLCQGTRPVAANLDQVVVVVAPAPATVDEAQIDRYLVLAEANDLSAAIVVNKADLLSAAERRNLHARLRFYDSVDYPVLFTSTVSGDGLPALEALLHDRSSVLMGPSGVGKSSLVQTLLPERSIRIGAISEQTGHGRHTTTVATLFHLPRGGDLVDAPGIRQMALAPLPADRLAAAFREFRTHLAACRFRDCRHTSEPGCAVAEAAADGAIPEWRLAHYRTLLETIGNG